MERLNELTSIESIKSDTAESFSDEISDFIKQWSESPAYQVMINYLCSFPSKSFYKRLFKKTKERKKI